MCQLSFKKAREKCRQIFSRLSNKKMGCISPLGHIQTCDSDRVMLCQLKTLSSGSSSLYSLEACHRNMKPGLDIEGPKTMFSERSSQHEAHTWENGHCRYSSPDAGTTSVSPCSTKRNNLRFLPAPNAWLLFQVTKFWGSLFCNEKKLMS